MGGAYAPPFCISDGRSEMIRLYFLEGYKDIHPQLKASSLTDRVLEDILACEGITSPVIHRTENGKPYVEEEDVFFSVSHSGALFACAVSDFNIGLDIQIRDPKDPLKISKRYFTPEECRFPFRRIWTRKEALIKYRGVTLKDVLNTETVLCREDVQFIDLDMEGDIMGCLCIPPEEDGAVEIICLNKGER